MKKETELEQEEEKEEKEGRGSTIREIIVIAASGAFLIIVSILLGYICDI